jgi:hypothetical protein
MSSETSPLCSETINGIEVRLGSLSCEQLLQLEAEARDRMVEAQTDLMIIQDVRERLYPEAGG